MRIKKLEGNIIAKIAAGEIIENPSSVIKELMDNCIDALATNIEIEFQNGGKDYIRVSDNGAGIIYEDLKIAFSRHATSKLNSVKDISTIESMGFRGEALPSIATVSNVELLSNVSSQSNAGKINLEFGAVLNVKPDVRTKGTTVVVTNLFGNMPARRNFLKTTRSEIQKNYDLIKKYALCYPEIKFKVISDGRKYIETSGSGSLVELLSQIYNNDLATSMIPIEYNSKHLDINGYISNVNIKKSSNVNINCFVNKRVVKNRIFNYAIERAYDSLLVKGDYPVCVLNLKLDPVFLDINVHPSKNEIKIRDEREIFSHVEKTIRSNLINYNTNKDDIFSNGLKFDFNVAEKQSLHNPLTQFEQKYNVKEFANKNNPNIQEFILSENDPKNLIFEFKLLGQLNDSYILGEYQKTICIIDQHAAHERVNYEKLQFNSANIINKQELLNPIILNLEIKENEWLEKNVKIMNELGFDIESFGVINEWKINKIPTYLINKNIESKVIKIISDFTNNISDTNNIDDRLKSLACHSSIEFGDKLSNMEMLKLIEDISNCKEPWKCPHGRPVLIQINEVELSKWFSRT